MITIEKGSPAWDVLVAAMMHADAHKVSIAIRADARTIIVKRNEGMWTPPLTVEADR